MASVRAGRRTRVRVATALLAVLLGAPALVSTAGAQTATITLAVDVTSFSQRAVAWSAANTIHRTAALERAEALGEAAAAEEAEAAAAEAARQAALEAAAAAAAAAATTTTAAPTTTTTAAPTTSSAPADDSSDPVDDETTTTTTVAPGGGPSAEQWAALRACESGGRYDALSPGGRYRGAYQFSQATWDWVASFANPALVGVDPAAASVGDQDAQARALYGRNGAGPWPHCGVHLQ